MTVSWVAFLPRQWPAQPEMEISYMTNEISVLSTALCDTVPVWVVAAEGHGASVGLHHARVPSNRLGTGRVTEVLDVIRRLVSPAKDVLPSMRCQPDGLIESTTELSAFGNIARRMDGVVRDCAAGPLISK